MDDVRLISRLLRIAILALGSAVHGLASVAVCSAVFFRQLDTGQFSRRAPNFSSLGLKRVFI